MTDPSDPVRPVPRWVRAWAALTAVTTFALLAVGGLVTSRSAGMSDPVWPTEPWFLAVNGQMVANEPRPGFLIEHTHRLVAFAVGGMAVVLALGAWAYEPNRRLRLFGLASVVSLVAAFGAFHGAMMESWKLEKQVTPAARLTGTLSAAGAVAVLAACGAAVAGPHRGRWVRALAGVGLIAVMVQGLLGGLRVFLNELVGRDLAAVHGVFGQVTFAVLVAAAVLAAPRRPGDALPDADRAALGWMPVMLTGLLVVQLGWAVLLRHHGTGLAQRLHVVTAFLVTGVAVWLAVRLLGVPAARRRFAGGAWHLLGLLAVQLLLGVEAYVGKFAHAGPHALTPPDMRPIETPQVFVRTAHQVIGAGLLAAAVGLSLRVGRTPIDAGSAVEPAAEREPAGVS